MKAQKEPTTTTLVTEVLRQADDFMSIEMIMIATGRNRNNVNAACHHLRKHCVVDVVIAPNGVGWWFALPPADDDRSRTVEERTPESKKRNRKSRKTKD